MLPPVDQVPQTSATCPVCIPAGTDVTQVRHGLMNTAATALPVSRRVVPPELVADARRGKDGGCGHARSYDRDPLACVPFRGSSRCASVHDRPPLSRAAADTDGSHAISCNAELAGGQGPAPLACPFPHKRGIAVISYRIFTCAARVRTCQSAGILPRSPWTQISVCRASTTSASRSAIERGVNLRHQHVSPWDVLPGVAVCWLGRHFRRLTYPMCISR